MSARDCKHGRLARSCSECDMEQEINFLRAENAAQALLIASLKEENESLVKQLDQNWVQHQEIVRAREQLSDTQRQNAELMQRVGEAEKDAERYRWFKDNYLKYGNSDPDTNRPIVLFEGRWYGGHFDNIDDLDYAIDAAISASKVSNEGDGKD
jgi:hypothetical protein